MSAAASSGRGWCTLAARTRAAAGGAYMVLLYGFLGLRFENGQPTLHPRLPEGWKKVQMQVHWQGKDWLLTAEEGQQT